VALESYLADQDLTVNALAIACGVEQSTLQRFMTGRTKTITPIIEGVLSYAQIDGFMHETEQVADICEDARIRRALHRVWDGRDASIHLLASLIEALEPVVRASHLPSMVR
jgi:hypothetical protein